MVKFLLSEGWRLREKLLNYQFPTQYQSKFLLSKILVVLMLNNYDAVAACGLRSRLNILTIYVKKGYRGQGLGKKVLKKTIEVAQRRNLSFIVLTVQNDNIEALRLYYTVGFKEIAQLRSSGHVFMVLPFFIKGELAYTFLHTICARLPENFLAYICNWIEERTLG